MLRSIGLVCGVGVGLYVAYKLVQRSRRSTTAQPTNTFKKEGESGSKAKSTQPHAEKHQPDHCDGCGKVNNDESLMRCGGCKRAWFCNGSCQTTYWPSHKNTCKAIELLNKKGVPSFKKGQYRETLAFLEQALLRATAAPKTEEAINMPMANQRTAMWAKGSLMRLQGDTHLRLNNLDIAQDVYHDALAIAQEAGDYAMTANVMSGMSSAARRAGKDPDMIRAILGTAMAAADKALQDDELEALRAKASILSNLGVINIMSPDSQPKGIGQLEEALEIRKHLGDPYQICITQVNVAGTYMCSGNEELAVKLYEEAAAVAKENSYTQVYVAVLINLSNQYEAGDTLCDYEKAAHNRRKLADALSNLNVGRELPTDCAICMEVLNVLETSTDDDSRIVIPECMHAMHKLCFERCHVARCPTCMSGVDMCPKMGTAPPEQAGGGEGDEHEPINQRQNNEVAAPAPAPAPAPTVEAEVVLEGHAVFDLE